MSEISKEKKIANLLFEIGTLRKLIRIHRQVLLTDDTSDNIASHSYRVALTGWLLAKEENADPYKVLLMCLFHDLPESRSGDHNWVHKRYVKIFEDEIIKDQFHNLPYPELSDVIAEYHKRESKEALVAKDADILDQILLLREYEWQGNQEAKAWLHGPDGSEPEAQIKKLKLESAKRIAKVIYTTRPSEWWDNAWSGTNR